MGCMRSAYSCPVFWYEGQTVPDVMYWYFADKCAGLFPFQHRFQTHYDYDRDMPVNSIGEQVGPRPYSKGHGPIGAPTDGLTWQGDLKSFVDGVEKPFPVPPLACEPTLIGLIPFPPPSTWGSPEFETTFSNGDWTPGPHSSNAGGYLDWYVLEFGIDPHDPASVITAHWHYVEGQGMVLYFGFSTETDSVYPVKSTSFIDVTETGTTAIWTYVFPDPLGTPTRITVTLVKCVP